MKPPKIALDKKNTLSFVNYALGVTDKPSPVAALEVGTYSLKLAEVLRHEEGDWELLGYWVKEISLEEGWTETEKQKELRRLAKAFLKETPLTAKKIHLGFGGNFFYVRKLTIPEMPKEDLPQALRWAARSLIPFNVETTPFEYEVLDTRDKKQEVLIVAAEEDFLMQWGMMLREAGFQPASMTAGILSLLEWMKKDEIASGEHPVALVDIGGRASTLFILRNGKIGFIRDLDTGGKVITQSLTQAIATTEGELKLGEQEAEKLKRLYGFPMQEQLFSEKLTASQMVSLMRPVLERLASEIRRSFQFFREGFGGDVRKVYLIGGSSQLKHLTAFFSEKMSCSVETLPLLKGVEWRRGNRVDEKDLSERFSFLAPVLAVAFGEGKGINFLPPRFREKKTQYLERVAMRVLSFSVLFVLLTFSVFQWLQVRFLKEEAKLYQSSWKMVQEVETLQREIQEHKEVHRRINADHPYILGALKEIANTLPPHAVLNRIVLYQKMSDLQISGTVFASSNKSVEVLLGELISSFEKSPLFKEVKLVSTQRDETYDQPANNFEIVCSLKAR